jgi:hypothetical protein
MEEEMIENRILTHEKAITVAVKRLLRVEANKLLEEIEYPIPIIGFRRSTRGDVAIPGIVIFPCERTEKESIMNLLAYTVIIAIPVQDTDDSILHTFMYYAAVTKAFSDNNTLGRCVESGVIIEERIIPPKKLHNDEDWKVIITLRLSVEGTIL